MACFPTPGIDWIKELRCITPPPAKMLLGETVIETTHHEVTQDIKQYFTLCGPVETSFIRSVQIGLNKEQVEEIWPAIGMDIEPGKLIWENSENLPYEIRCEKYCDEFVNNFRPFVAKLYFAGDPLILKIESAELTLLRGYQVGVRLHGTW